jgi:DNA-directed RNA polymerase specialized sigma54-like protein
MATLNISEAARKWGMHRSTLQRAVASGKVSCKTEENGSKHIDLSEMLRVYGDAATVNELSRPTASDTLNMSHKLELLELHKRYLTREVDSLKIENERLAKLVDGQRDMLAIWHRRLSPPKKK